LKPVRPRAVIPLPETFQFELQPQHLNAEFFGLPLVLLRTPLLGLCAPSLAVELGDQ
jgi:hypothetical protein